MTLMSVPVIDIAPFRSGTPAERAAVAAEVARACTDIGFLVISGHGVPSELIDETYTTTKNFFESPLETKLAVARPEAGQIRGYSGVEQEGLGLLEDEPVPADLKESFDIGPLDVPADDPYYSSEAAGAHFAPNLWPATSDEFEQTYRRYYRAMETLTLEMFEIFATALELPTGFFVDKVDRHISLLRTNYYPPQPDAPKPNQLRGGAHSDYTAMTILWQEDVPGGGLQVQNKAGEWVDVPVVPGTFVVNLGDSLERWTNDKWVSTMHRVVNPPREVAATHSRVSIPYFVQPNYDAVIECIDTCFDDENPAKYGPVRNGEYLFMKFTQQNTLAGVD
jgi:isopenicillin N synthase-like dioxygenase